MAQMRKKTKEIRGFITSNVTQHPSSIVAYVCEHFNISRQAAARHVRSLVDEGLLEARGATRDRLYKLAVIDRWNFNYDLSETNSEAEVWNRDLQPIFEGLPENVVRIWYTGFTEMFNNVIDHSCSETAAVIVEKTAVDFELIVMDQGVGIFKKIKDALSLTDERHAVLELAKGKFTTDPDNHTGMGVFFSYHAFDVFNIVSGTVFFTHAYNDSENWLLDYHQHSHGTAVFLRLNNNTERSMADVYDSFSSPEDFSFNQTVVPVLLAEYGDDKLVSRSQAKRVLVRIDKFESVVFNFEGVDYIGQAFADEIFRVFQNSHPDLEMISINANEVVSNMISRAQSTQT